MSVPLVRLFSLDLLKAFVAVGRRMSITQAADDLCLTQSAVSRQIHTFEEQVGTALFVRKQRGVAFTEDGERLFHAADHAIRQLQDIAAEIPGGSAHGAVTITSSIGITGLWLLPRLSRLQERHPRIDVRLAANNTVSDLRGEGIDLAVRYARETTVPPNAVRLFDETLAPVAHPRLAQALRRGEACPLLEYENTRPWLQWRRWFDDERWQKDRRQVLHFNQYDQVIQAAIAAQGVAIGRIELLQSLIDSEQLAIVDLPCTPQPSPYAVWLLAAAEAPRDEVLKVAEWIQLEAAQVRQWRRPEAGRQAA
ncbi:LysR substrate-binding domain-containing protein [Ramlibacter pallidus]|uniref:LysR family transcriptional regulator n=1 Tax=Ramlibacter pallidus TaxID=2780087 RepID=A0ABR9S111_9BURK|nr:LysR substrate-binding domain-containing protein [Ramlibacter pallidus]MBE7367173.1 LysR family transcriptional regulator [Ramlibacter pallidus]